MISLSHVSTAYGTHVVLIDVSFTVAAGDIVGLLGRNGAGKTTAVETIAGLRERSSGEVIVCGSDPLLWTAADRQQLGLQPQAGALAPSLRVGETVELFAAISSDTRSVPEILQQVGLAEAIAQPVGVLSGGQYRRLLLAIATLGDPRVVLLDEPSAGLDPLARRELHELVRALASRGVAVLLTTHDMAEASELCDRILILRDGAIVASGSPAELVSTFGAGTRVRFRTPEPVAAELLLSSDGKLCSARESDGFRNEVQTGDPDEFIRRLTFARGVRATGITTHVDTLEDVFVRLAGDSVSTWSEASSGTNLLENFCIICGQLE